MGFSNLKACYMEKKRIIVSCVQIGSKHSLKSKLIKPISFTKFAIQNLGRGQRYYCSSDFWKTGLLFSIMERISVLFKTGFNIAGELLFGPCHTLRLNYSGVPCSYCDTRCTHTHICLRAHTHEHHKATRIPKIS